MRSGKRRPGAKPPARALTPLYKRCRTGYTHVMLRSTLKCTTTTKTPAGVVEARAR